MNAGLCLGIAALAVILLLTRASISDLIASRRDIGRAEDVVSSVQRAMSLAKDAETGGRGLVITGAPAFLGPLEIATAELGPALEELRVHAARDRALIPLVDSLHDVLLRRLSIQQEIVAIRRDHGAGSAAALIAAGSGKPVMDTARRMADDLSRRGVSALRTREFASEADASRAMVVVQLAAFVGLLLGVLTLIAFNRELSVRQRAERQLARALSWTSSIMEVQQDVATAGFDVRPLVQKVLARAQALTGADGVAVEVLDDDELVHKAGSGTLLDSTGTRMPSRGSLSGLCIATGEPQVCADAETDARVDLEACRAVGARSLVVVPLLHERASLGVLKACSTRPGAFGDDEC